MTDGSLQGARPLRTAASGLAACALIAVLAGCALSIGGLQHRTHSYAIGSRATTLVITNQAGDIQVTGGSSDTISVTEHISFHGTAPATTHRTANDSLSLDSNCPAAETCTVGYVITAPRRTTVRVTDGAGDLTLASLDGPVTAHVNAGRISLSSLGGPVDVTSNAGSINGRQLSSASASLRVSAGQINVAFTAPPSAITATTEVGAISVRVPGSVPYHVTASATVGDVHVGVAGSTAASRTITASTRTGSITIAPAT